MVRREWKCTSLVPPSLSQPERLIEPQVIIERPRRGSPEKTHGLQWCFGLLIGEDEGRGARLWCEPCWRRLKQLGLSPHSEIKMVQQSKRHATLASKTTIASSS